MALTVHTFIKFKRNITSNYSAAVTVTCTPHLEKKICILSLIYITQGTDLLRGDKNRIKYLNYQQQLLPMHSSRKQQLGHKL